MSFKNTKTDLPSKSEIGKVNKYSLVSAAVCVIFYVSNYFLLLRKGEVTVSQFFISSFLVVFLLCLSSYIYFSNKESPSLKLFILFTFLLPFIFLILVGENKFTYTLIFPMIILLGLYNDIKFTVYSSVVFLVLNSISVVPYVIRDSNYISANLRGLLLQFVVVFVCVALQITHIKVYSEIKKEKSEDEEFNLRKLEEILSSVSDISKELDLRSEELYSHSEKLSNFSLSGIKDVEFFGDILNDLKEISSSVEQNMNRIIEASDEAMSDTIAGNKQMEKVIGSMEMIREKCSQINEITNTVNEIAFQTNILALNASVEAAHAGAQGKGFSVVAEEVRSLSDRSAEAANSTAALLDNTLASVEQGNRDIEKIYQIFKTIQENTQNTTKFINEIHEAVNVQKKKTEELEYSLEKIRIVIGALSESAKENTNTSEILNESTKNLTDVMSHVMS